MAEKLHEGQDVSWRWGGGNATGKIDEIVEEGRAEVTSNKVGQDTPFLAFIHIPLQGNTVSRIAREGDPAVKISRKGNDVVKLAHELNEVKDSE
ncbi:hypothetical protein NLI96_g4485 [Meripilus lineatus]|uniref:Hypervirulence associated protein TUDOR domain-containing protein n=1 Tax=Meripilus lineatus TaxID=2056292 RepID=A0AAD5V4S9_9APHY|nr:hypothetical protein NLI96_g4485 [Physisporinus lineatus]